MILTNDKQLIRSLANVNLDAFDEIMLRYQQMAREKAYCFLGDLMEAGNVAQEAFLKILEAATRYRPTSSFRICLWSMGERGVPRNCKDQSP